MLFSTNFFLWFTIALWIVIGGLLYFSPFVIGLFKPDADIYKIERYRRIGKYIFTFGWLGILPLCLTLYFIVPDVQIVSMKNGVLTSNRYYVPFYFKGHICGIGGEYVYNNTHTRLAIYPIYGMDQVDKRDIRVINGHSICKRKAWLHTERPDRYFFNTKYGQTKWYINTIPNAEQDIADITWKPEEISDELFKLDKTLREKLDSLSKLKNGVK